MSLGADRKTRLWKIIANLAAVFGITLLMGGQAFASWPYFKTTGGDIATGGWFNNDAGNSQTPCTGTGYYQTPDWTSNATFGNTYKQGGILSFSGLVSGAPAGAGSQYAAYSLGEDEFNGAPANHYGFLTNNNPPTTGSNATDFSNFWSLGANPPVPAGFNSGTTPAFGGGLLEGSNGHNAWHCIPDYFNDYQNSSPAPTDLTGTANQNTMSLVTVLNGANGIQYKDNPPNGTGGAAAGAPGLVTINASSLPASWNHTLFIDGNVYIGGNITYQAHTAVTVQKFALVVLGNIYVGAGVTQLDGIYIAQPDMTNAASIASSGAFWSCQNATGSWTIPTDLASIGASCKPAPSLTVNGSVIASQVLLTRLNGGLAPGGGNLIDTGVSETFNYTPEVVIGGSFNASGSGSQSGQIDSLVSLPPVF